jgi:hypothetical protein
MAVSESRREVIWANCDAKGLEICRDTAGVLFRTNCGIMPNK